METNKIDNGCKSKNDNEMQRTGFDINVKDLTETGKLFFLPSKSTTAKVEIEITDNAINLQTRNVSIKIPLSNEQDANLISQQGTLKQDPYEEVARKFYIKDCDINKRTNK